MTVFINTVYLRKTANVGVAVVFLLALLLLSGLYLSPAQEPGGLGVAGMGGIRYRPLSVTAQPFLLQGTGQSF